MEHCSGKKAWVLLLLITVMGGALRFACLDRPLIWTDEAYTHFRVSGSFEEMFQILKTEGFSPLHYELYWGLGRMLGGPEHLTPLWMRVLPALWGTLLIPAMYFLARQFFNRKIALMTALATASSAYMMVYSHDAKMYMLLWLGVALSVGALFSWMRTGIRLAFWGWVAASLLMCGTHALGLIILGLEFLIFLTAFRGDQRNQDQGNQGDQGDLKKLAMFVLGLMIVLSGPAIYYTRFNQWTHKLEKEGWQSSGLAWIGPTVEGRKGGGMLLEASSAFLLSWEWPRGDYDTINAQPHPMNQSFDWMLGGYQIHPGIRWGLSAVFVLMVAACLMGWVWPRREGRLLEEEQSRLDGHQRFWLLVWGVLPFYGFYLVTCHGLGRSPVTPWGGLMDVLKLFSISQWVVGISGVVVLVKLCARYRPLPYVLALICGIIIVFAWGVGVTQVAHTVYPDNYEGFVGLERICRATWHAVSRDYPNPQSGFAQAASWMMFILYGVILPVLWIHGYCVRNEGFRIQRLRGWFWTVALLWIAMGGVYVVLTICLTKTGLGRVGPIWVPRYLGIAWPAFIMGFCVLIGRLPNRPLRLVLMTLWVGVNLAQGVGRMAAQTEPRVDLMVEDLYHHQSEHERVYLQPYMGSLHPAGGNMENAQGFYYAAIERGKPWPPTERSTLTLITDDVNVTMEASPARIARDVENRKTVDRVIVWDQIPIDAIKPPEDEILVALGSNWTKSREQPYTVRYHWNWSRLYVLRRREYSLTQSHGS